MKLQFKEGSRFEVKFTTQKSKYFILMWGIGPDGPRLWLSLRGVGIRLREKKYRYRPERIRVLIPKQPFQITILRKPCPQPSL